MPKTSYRDWVTCIIMPRGGATAYGSLFVDGCVVPSVHGIQHCLQMLIRATQIESDSSSKMD